MNTFVFSHPLPPLWHCAVELRHGDDLGEHSEVSPSMLLKLFSWTKSRLCAQRIDDAHFNKSVPALDCQSGYSSWRTSVFAPVDSQFSIG